MGDQTGLSERTFLFSQKFYGYGMNFFIKISLCFGTARLSGNQYFIKDRAIKFLQKISDKAAVQIHIADGEDSLIFLLQEFQNGQKIWISKAVPLFHSYFHRHSCFWRNSCKWFQAFPDFFKYNFSGSAVLFFSFSRLFFRQHPERGKVGVVKFCACQIKQICR